MTIEELERSYQRMEDLFFTKCREAGLRVDETLFEMATGISVGRNRRQWQVILVSTAQGKRKNHSLGLVPDEDTARQISGIYSAAKHILRAIERLRRVVKSAK